MQIIELDLTKVLRVKSPQEVSICSNQVSGLVNYLVVDLCRVIARGFNVYGFEVE